MIDHELNNEFSKSISREFTSSSELRANFPQLIESRFFVGPLEENLAKKEFLTYFKQTSPMLVFECDDGFYVVYP